ncbi:hypothetical protein BST91_03260 [Nonlabens tegetincola]|nr:hypothetical protein BST91_03260 [Nonlabens tegetincola]
MFIFTLTFISCSSNFETEEDMLSMIEEGSSVYAETQKILNNNPNLILDSNGLIVLPISESSDISKNPLQISAVIIPSQECDGDSNGFIYQYYATANNISFNDRLVKIAFIRDGFPFFIREVTIPSGSYNSDLKQFSWYSTITIGDIDTNVLEVHALVNSPDLSIDPNGNFANKLNVTSSYQLIPLTNLNINNCILTTPVGVVPDYPVFGGGGDQDMSSFKPCDCDNDGIPNYLDNDDNNNNIQDSFETNFAGCTQMMVNCED